MRLGKLLVLSGLFVGFWNAAMAADPTTKSLHEKAVKLAFDDKLEQSLAILEKILDRDPNNYPVYRDYTLYTAWSGRCNKALALFEKIKNRPKVENYLLAAIGDCIASQRSLAESIAFLQAALEKYPNDKDLTKSLKSKKESLADLKRAFLDAEASFNNGNKASAAQQAQPNTDSSEETKFQLRLTQPIGENLQVYARYLRMDSKDPELATGDLNRVGVGLRWGINKQLAVTQDLSMDVDDEDEESSTTTVHFKPHDQWEFTLLYSTWDEGIPLRVQVKEVNGQPAIQTESDRLSFEWFWHTPDYRYEWFSSISQNEFTTDGVVTNERDSIYTEVSYGLELGAKREQRIGLEVSRSENTNGQVVYFNPKEDLSIVLAYKMHLTYKSKFRKHVDHLALTAGIYEQETFPPIVVHKDPIYGFRYEQEYEFSRNTGLRIGGAYNSAVYDGNREDQFEFHIAVHRKLW